MAPRPRISLDGPWSFATDPHDAGISERWYQRTGFERTLSLPGAWQLAGADLVAYTGVAWYQRSFEAPALASGERLVLGFEAVDYECRVWLNGSYLGAHEGGYTPFSFTLAPDCLRPGTNQLVLRVLDPSDNAEIPHGKQGSWYTRVSGPWQPIWLETRPALHVAGLRCVPEPFPLAQSRVHFELDVQGPAGTPYEIVVTDPGGEEVGRASGLTVPERDVATPAGPGPIDVRLSGALGQVAVPAPRLWCPDDPALYRVSARVGLDELGVTIGMCHVERRDGLVHLNKQPLYLRGALDQGFWPETIYRPPSLEAIEHEITLAKAMGLNLLRKHIKLEDPRYLDACDRLGMLIWEEPACFYKYTDRAKARFKREIEAMVARDRHHPSIIIWSLYNEEWGLEWRLWHDEEKQRHLESLHHWAKAVDPTRLWCDNSGWAHVRSDINDFHRYYASPDQQEALEADLARCLAEPATNFVAARRANATGVPVMISEFGMWGLSEPSRILDFYQGRPWWFDAQWAGHTEEFKSPATAERHFARFGLDTLFGDPDGLAKACQARMLRGLKGLIEPMRRRPDLAGYVVTELSDVEWEANGWLDYFRKPKAPPAQFAAFNGPIVVMAELAHHVLWDDGRAEGTLWISNHTARALTGVVRWQVTGSALAGEVAVAVAPFASVPVGRLGFEAPRTQGHDVHTLALALEVAGEVVAQNGETLHVVGRALAQATDAPRVYLHGAASTLREALGEAGVPLVALPAPRVLWLATRLDAALRTHVEAGGQALLVVAHGEADVETGFVSLRKLPPDESWDRASSVHYVRPELFPALTLETLPGWEWEGMFPRHVVPLTGYLHDFGGRGVAVDTNQGALAPARILAGYFEGWAGKVGATIARVSLGDGELLVTTLPLVQAYGRQPVATAMLNRLLSIAQVPLPIPAGRQTSNPGSFDG